MGLESPAYYDSLLLQKCKKLIGDALNKKNKQTNTNSTNGKTTLEQLIKDIDCADKGTKLGIEHLVSETIARRPRKPLPRRQTIPTSTLSRTVVSDAMGVPIFRLSDPNDPTSISVVPVRRSDSSSTSGSEDEGGEYVDPIFSSDEDEEVYLEDNLGGDQDEDVIVEAGVSDDIEDEEMPTGIVRDMLALARARTNRLAEELIQANSNPRIRRSTFSEDFTQNGPSSNTTSTNSNTSEAPPTTSSATMRAVPAMFTAPNGDQFQLTSYGGYPVVDFEPITPPATVPVSPLPIEIETEEERTIARIVETRFEEHSRLRRMENAEERDSSTSEVQALIDAVITSDAARAARVSRVTSNSTATSTSNSNSTAVVVCPEPLIFNPTPSSATLAEEAAAIQQRSIARLPTTSSTSDVWDRNVLLAPASSRPRELRREIERERERQRER